MTRLIEFDPKGLRSNVEIDLMSLSIIGLNKIGTFKLSNSERLTFLPPLIEEYNTDENTPINEMTFNVIISEVIPFLLIKKCCL